MGVSRSFQELANGMVMFHDALKISQTPFPFPYAQTCYILLMIHWFMTPFVLTAWVEKNSENSAPELKTALAMLFCFLQVFILWSLRAISVEIQNPFGQDENDLNQEAMQIEMNSQLLLLVSESTLRTPKLAPY